MPDHRIELTSGEFDKLRALIHQTTGITVNENRRRLLQSRLSGRLRELDEVNFNKYISRLKSDGDELQELVNRVTTNETYCYRTPRIWEYFEEEFVPSFIAKKLPRPMKVWSAAASTGEEAHTIGVVLENTRLKAQGFDYSVLGTDISSRVIKKAEQGLYSGRSIERLKSEKPDLLKNHMIGNEEDGYVVKPEIKTRINFKLHNLVETLSPSQMFDIVFLRNVLIYFSNPEQETILRNIGRQMNPDAVLIIGESETLTRLDTDFEQVAPLIYRLSTG